VVRLQALAAVVRLQALWAVPEGAESMSLVRSRTQTTAAASLDSGSDSALTASDSCLTSA
jgi:hypothetical protein